MAILVVCPSCGGKLNAPNQLLGRMAKCPQCGQTIKVTSSKDSLNPPAQRQPASAQRPGGNKPELPDPDEQAAIRALAPRRVSSRKAKDLPSEPDGRDVDIEVIGLDSQAGRTVGSENPSTHSRMAYGLGIPSLILAIIAVGLTWIPFVGLLSMPLSGLGLLLGIAGLVVAIVQRGRGISIAIAGSALSLVALVIGVFWLLKGLDAAAKQSGLKEIMTVAGQDQEQKNVAPHKPSEEKEAQWADASKGPVRQGDIRVQIGEVSVRNVRIKDVLGEETVSPAKNLTIKVLIDNASKTRKIDFLGWSGAGANAFALTDLLGGAGRNKSNVAETVTAPGRNAASLTDNFGNPYKRVSLELGAQIPGQISTATSIYPGKQIEDLLVFEPPIDNVQFLRLELPAGAFAGTGSLRLQIPKGMIHR